MLIIFLIGATIIIISGLNQYHKWQLGLYREELSNSEWEIHCQAERIQELERERARLHFQLLAHLNEPGQQVNVYRN